MRVAAIDLGTNSFLCLIAEVNGRAPSATLETVFDTYKIVRLGEKVHTNRSFLPEALKRAEVCLDEFSAIIKKHKAVKVIATATSAARDASNGHELMKLGRDRGIPIHIIGGPKEAELSFEGAISGLADAHKKKILVVDVGGGSTEFIYREPGGKIRGHSFDVGCVRLTEMFLKKDPVDSDELEFLSAYAQETIKGYGRVTPDLVVAVAGTPTTLACVAQGIDFNESLVEGYILTRRKIEELSALLGGLPLSQRKSVRGLEPLRADVINAGCVLLLKALDLAGADELRVSTRGLRFGVALHHDEFKD
jgi:exopolyphosphatase / guanosine-5'-triphosphate,3'-diphosphate pyrophosphatase